MADPKHDPEQLAARVAALERAVQTLGNEVANLRTSAAADRTAARKAAAPEPHVVDALPDYAASARATLASAAARSTGSGAAGGGHAPGTPSSTSASQSPGSERTRSITSGLDLETLIGRYGMLGLATLLALAAVGTFLSWAIAHGLLGPVARVVLGLALGAGLGGWGFRLRRRERSFGDSLLGLALAIVHVCAWAAGPSLQIVPVPLALAFSATVSVALAAFALVEGDEPLWCVGFGGAAVAPFVTSTGQGTAPMLAGYGAAVLVAGGSALASRPWAVAARVYSAAAALFTGALLAMPRSQHGAMFAVALPLLAAGAGVLPFARGEALRPRLRTLGMLAAVAAAWLPHASGFDLVRSAALIALAAAVWLLLLDRADTEAAGTLMDGWGDAPASLCDWVDGAVIPAAFLAAMSDALGRRPDTAAAALGLATVAHLALAARRNESDLRDALAAVSWGSAMCSTLLVLRDAPIGATAALAWVSVLATLVGRAVPSRTWRWAPFASLVLASVWNLGFLTMRPHYESLPFTTRASAAAAAIAVAWVLALRLSTTSAAWPWATGFVFLWVHQELAYAVSPATSTLLLVSWYAISSVAAVGAGRARGSARLRHLGLGLGVTASAIAVHAGFQLASVGARIAACAVASAFLLGIAWWYRRPNEAPAADPAAP